MLKENSFLGIICQNCLKLKKLRYKSLNYVNNKWGKIAFKKVLLKKSHCRKASFLKLNLNNLFEGKVQTPFLLSNENFEINERIK